MDWPGPVVEAGHGVLTDELPLPGPPDFLDALPLVGVV